METSLRLVVGANRALQVACIFGGGGPGETKGSQGPVPWLDPGRFIPVIYLVAKAVEEQHLKIIRQTVKTVTRRFFRIAGERKTRI